MRVLLLLLVGLSYLLAFNSNGVRVNTDPDMNYIGACVLGMPKKDYIRVCVGNTRYAIVKDSIGEYYIEKMFKDINNPSARCNCKIVTQAKKEYYAKMAKEYNDYIEKQTLQRGYIAIGPIRELPSGTKKRTVKIKMAGTMPTEIIAVKIPPTTPIGLNDGKKAFTCVKCN